MATYIQGITDYIPKLQPFKPDLNFYAKALSVKQDRYDAALKKIGNIYGTLLYSPLTVEENIKRRDDYFKAIEQDLKKITSMDLSLPQNQGVAMSIFEPLITDKSIAHDMAFTKKSQEELQGGQNLKNCNNPDECGGEWWDVGDAYIYGKLQDYSKAPLEERLKMGAPEYHPKVNITQQAFEWITAQKLVVDQVTPEGNYLVSRQDGQQMLIPLQQIIQSVFGDDQKVRGMYDAQAYVERKNGIAQYTEEFGGDELRAEQEYMKDIMRNTGEALLERQKMAEGKNEYIKYKKGALEAKLKREGISKKYAVDSPIYQDYMNTLDSERYSQVTNDYYQKLAAEIRNIANNPSDIVQMRNRIDKIVSAGRIEEKVKEVATLYADTHSAITKIEEDQFKLEYVKHIYKMEEDANNHNLDYQKQLKLKIFDMTKDMFNLLKMSGGNMGGKSVSPDADQFSGPGGNPFKEAVMKSSEGSEQSATAERQYIQTIVDKADSILSNPNSSASEILTAKSIKKQIFKEAYDATNDQYVYKGNVTKDWKKSGIPNSKQVDFFNNANNVYLQNKGLFNVNESNELQKLSDYQNNYWSMKTAASSVLKYNSNAIYNLAEAEMPRENALAFKRLFKKESNGSYVLKSQQEFVDSYVNLLPNNMSDSNKRKKAIEEYNKQSGIFVARYNQGGKYMRSLNGLALAPGGADGSQAPLAKQVYNFDATAPIMEGTQAIISLRDDLYTLDLAGGQARNFLKVVHGENLLKKDYDKIAADDPDSKAAGQLLTQFLFDFNKPYTTDSAKQTAPRGILVYKNTAANTAGVESYSVYIDKATLQTYADSKGMILGKSVDDWASKPITVYKEKARSNTMLTKAFEQHPFDALVRAGNPLRLTKPNAGNITIQYKKNNQGTMSTFANGETYDYVRQSDGTIKTIVNRIDNMEIDDSIPGLSPGKFYAGIREMFDKLETQNYNIKFRGANDKMVYSAQDLQELASQAQLRQGMRRPTEQEQLLQGFGEEYGNRMEMANEMIKIMEGYGGR
jgi:hypothetical protein